MSHIDLASRHDPRIGAPRDVQLHLRFSGWQAFYFWLAVLFLVGLFGFTTLMLTDPNFHLDTRPGDHWHGRGRAIVLLLLLLPIAVRAALLWSFCGAVGLALLARAFRFGDSNVDYVIGRRGVTDIGLFHEQHLDWSDVRRVILFEQRTRLFRWSTGCFAQFDTGLDPNVHGAVQRASQSLFARRRITIPLRFLDIEPEEIKAIVQRFQPEMPIVEETRHVG